MWGMSPPKAKGSSQAMGELPLRGEGLGGGGEVSQGPNLGQSLFLRNALRDDHLGKSFLKNNLKTSIVIGVKGSITVFY